MAKCHRCGTRVDQNSLQCHMCGASFEGIELEGSYKDDGFADNFFAQIGGVVSNEQNTILNNSDVSVDNAEISTNTAILDNTVFVANEETAESENYNSVVNNANLEMNDTSNQVSNNVDDEDEMLNEIKHKLDREEAVSDVMIEKITEERRHDHVDDYVDRAQSNVTVNKSFIFNTACFVIFILILIFAYFTFIKAPVSSNTELGGLSYKIDSEFVLTNENSGSKYYNYNNDNCALRVTYGSATSDGFLSSYFDTVREGFKGSDKYAFQNDEIKVKNNTWSGLSVMEMVESPNSPGGYTSKLKYKYASIVHNANFYHIVFVNLDSNEQCNKMFNDFMNTLEFK